MSLKISLKMSLNVGVEARGVGYICDFWKNEILGNNLKMAILIKNLHFGKKFKSLRK